MAWDWQRFLDQHRVEHQTSGPNVSRGNVTVHCPFCGADDPGHHMSVNLEGKGWRCWRNPAHRGRKPARLVAGLLGISLERARDMVGETPFVPDDFIDRVRGLSASKQAQGDQRSIKLPKEFRPFGLGKPSERPYRNYLRERGVGDADIDMLTKRYAMFYCTEGPYAKRIIFTVKFEGRLVNWTGRHLSPNVTLRYKTLSIDPETARDEGTPVAVGAISHYLLWYDRLLKSDCDTLVLCEGPFDALKVDLLGWDYGICSTCFFTAAPTREQIELLHTAYPQFKRRILLLDKNTLALGARIVADLSALDVRLGTLPKGLKDPGLFDRKTFKQFVLALPA